MRQIGNLSERLHAERFAAYLVTQGIVAHAEADGGAWAIWVRDENHVGQAKSALAEFQQQPDDPQYRDAERSAAQLQREAARQRQSARSNVIEMRGRWGRGGVVSPRRAPLTFVLIALSVLASLWTNFGNLQGKADQLGFVEQSRAEQVKASGWTGPFFNIQAGQVWRLFTPIFVHLDALHLAMNMYWLYRFGSQIEHFRGALVLGGLVLLTALLSNVAQALVESPYFFGMSGVAFGLFGYVWIKSMYDPSARVFVSRSTALFFVIYFFLCLFNFFPVANTAHGVGLFVGAAAAYLPLLIRPGGKKE